MKFNLLFIILLSMISKEILTKDYRFQSRKEFEDYCSENEKYIWFIDEISTNKNVFYLYPKTGEIIQFDYRIEKGWFNTFNELRLKFLEQEVELRNVLAKMWGGIQFSRGNYLAEKDKIINFEQHYDYFNAQITKVFDIKDFEKFNDMNLSNMTKKLRLMTKEELINIEIPLMFYFIQYSIKTYDSSFKLIQKQNQFKETYYSISLILKGNKMEFDVGNDVFLSLYPDYFRDDFDNKEDVKINIEIIKKELDFHNRANIKFVHD